MRPILAMSNFFSGGMPVPEISEDTKEFWEACKQHRLLIQRCGDCGSFRMNPAPVCYNCRSFNWDWIESQGRGEVYSYIIVHHAVSPATRSAIPYNAAVIRLNDCGRVKLTSNIIGCRNEEICVGMPVEVVWEDTTPQVTLYRFCPVPRAET